MPPSRPRLAALAVVLALACAPSCARAGAAADPSQESAMYPHHVQGPFDVRLVPQSVGAAAEAAGIARQVIEKRFHGALEAVGVGEMLAHQRLVYVALDRITGTLEGRRGSFLLVHRATMVDGVPTLEIDVVPGTGTDELQGLAGRLGIDVVDGAHRYRFDYALPESVAR